MRNVKLSAKIPLTPLDIAIRRLEDKDVKLKKFDNFISFKKNFSFVLFRPSQDNSSHVNITKVSNTGDSLQESLEELKLLLNTTITRFQVDNIIATLDLKRNLNLAEISAQTGISVLYNSECFPGLFIKCSGGTAILYHSGKVVIVGCNNLFRLEIIRLWLVSNFLQ